MNIKEVIVSDIRVGDKVFCVDASMPFIPPHFLQIKEAINVEKEKFALTPSWSVKIYFKDGVKSSFYNLNTRLLILSEDAP